MSKKRIVWHRGPPPSIGWWPASCIQNSNRFRWWDGKQWSQWAHKDTTAEQADRLASTPSHDCGIEWADRPKNWPERSRT